MNHSLLVRVVIGRIYPRRFKKVVVVVKKDAKFLLPIIMVIQNDLFDIKKGILFRLETPFLSI